MPKAPWSSYTKSVKYPAPLLYRPVPMVGGNASGKGQPAGAGRVGSVTCAAGGAPAGRPVTSALEAVGWAAAIVMPKAAVLSAMLAARRARARTERPPTE